MKYRPIGEKNLVVQAEQWFPGKTLEGVRTYGDLAFLDRIEGDVPIQPGDWIIKTPSGTLYVIGDWMFHRIYEKADAA